jgi:hypothetical protein
VVMVVVVAWFRVTPVWREGWAGVKQYDD